MQTAAGDEHASSHWCVHSVYGLPEYTRFVLVKATDYTPLVKPNETVEQAGLMMTLIRIRHLKTAIRTETFPESMDSLDRESHLELPCDPEDVRCSCGVL